MQDHQDQSDLDKTQPSPTFSPRDLDWRPSDYQSGGDAPPPDAPSVRRVSRPEVRRRRPPTEGAPAWVVGLGVGALLAVIVLLVVAFVFSRRSNQAAAEPSPTPIIVTPTATLAPRPTATSATGAEPTEAAPTNDAAATIGAPTDTIAVGGYVKIVADSGLSFRQTASTTGALIQVLDSGSVLQVIAGPQEAGGYTWWQLRKLDDGQEGWSAQGTADQTFLSPAPAP